MKILVVSDVPSRSLEALVSRHPESLKNIDLIISCGDLDREYLEFLAEGLHTHLFFVRGNHSADDDTCDTFEPADTEQLWDHIKALPKKIICHIAGSEDLHGRIEVFRNYLIVGFGGCKWYNGKSNQFTEREMARVVRQTARRIKWYLLRRKLLLKKTKKIIVVTHAPVFHVHDQPDLCHTGFKCFTEFIRKVKPLLWMHGHVHLQNECDNQVTLVEDTTVINASGYKFIAIAPEKIEVSYRSDILDKQH